MTATKKDSILLGSTIYKSNLYICYICTSFEKGVQIVKKVEEHLYIVVQDEEIRQAIINNILEQLL